MITKFLPGHDTPILSNDGETSVNISFYFSAAMSCDKVTSSIKVESTTDNGSVGKVDAGSIKCANISIEEGQRAPYIGSLASAWSWSATLTNLRDGVHRITVQNATTLDLGSNTETIDSFLLRVGAETNPIVFPSSANYSSSLLSSDSDGKVWITQQAPGANKWRYSLNWESSWSEWKEYAPGNVTLDAQPWYGTKKQQWDGHHVVVQYWSQLLGSSSFTQHSDSQFSGSRRFPHMFANGAFNQYGFDGGYKNELRLGAPGQWEWHYMDEWPGAMQLNVWGMNPDGQPDQTYVLGDIDGDLVLDRLPPSAMVPIVINVTGGPEYPLLVLQARRTGFQPWVPTRASGRQAHPDRLLRPDVGCPLLTGFLASFVFIGSFYKVKVVEKGIKGPGSSLAAALQHPFSSVRGKFRSLKSPSRRASLAPSDNGENAVGLHDLPPKRRTVLIATVEYNIDDWNIKVKIGGLGVMAQLMGKALGHQDLIWVVPVWAISSIPKCQRRRQSR